MLKKILILLIVLVAAFAIVVSRQPSEFRVERSATIDAPAAKVFALVNNLQKWESWSPWANLDPKATHSLEGPAEGVGATMRWSGNREVGEGSLVITESKASELVQYKLDMVKPFAGSNMSEFHFDSDGDKTNVTWSLYGEADFIHKAMGLIFNCKKMVGERFEQGLENLKTVAEKDSE